MADAKHRDLQIAEVIPLPEGEMSERKRRTGSIIGNLLKKARQSKIVSGALFGGSATLVSLGLIASPLGQNVIGSSSHKAGVNAMQGGVEYLVDNLPQLMKTRQFRDAAGKTSDVLIPIIEERVSQSAADSDLYRSLPQIEEVFKSVGHPVDFNGDGYYGIRPKPHHHEHVTPPRNANFFRL